MSSSEALLKAFKESNIQLAGHGQRNVKVLKEAFHQVDGNIESDIYGSGKIIEDFQHKMAALLGKESAVFFPSGTMAQQIALRIWCDRKNVKKVAYHPLCHLEIHEADGLKELHHIETVLLADKTRVITLEDVLNMEENIACLLLELPQREIGGQLPDFETLVEISKYCREKGIQLHLDGARLLEILPYYQKSAAEVCDLFDSVYISVYKGIGGIAGALLVGDIDFTQESKVWKQRYGGNLISLYPYIISADVYFDQRVEKMDQYYRDAKDLATRFNSCHAVTTIPAVPVSNMFHVHFEASKEEMEPILKDIMESSKVGISSYVRGTSDHSCTFEISVGDQYESITENQLNSVFGMLNERMEKIKN